MNASVLDVLKQAQTLSPDDKLDLVMALLKEIRASTPHASPKPKWATIRGSVRYPVMGEDAQVAVNRMRDEWDARETSLRNHHEG